MQPAVSYILFNTSYHEQTGDIITFHSFKRGFYYKKLNSEKDEPILASINGSSTDNDYDDRSISLKALEVIWNRSQIHPELNAGYYRLEICERIKQTQN